MKNRVMKRTIPSWCVCTALILSQPAFSASSRAPTPASTDFHTHFKVVLIHPDKAQAKSLEGHIQKILLSFGISPSTLESVTTHLSHDAIKTILDPRVQEWKNAIQKIETHYFQGHLGVVTNQRNRLSLLYHNIPRHLRIRHNLAKDWIQHIFYQTQSEKVLRSETGDGQPDTLVRRLLKQFPLAEFSPQDYPREFVLRTERIRRALWKQIHSIHLNIESSPPDAQVFLNDYPIGNTPLSVTIPFDPKPSAVMSVSLVKPGYKFFEKAIAEVRRDEVILIHPKLQKETTPIKKNSFSTSSIQFVESKLNLDQVVLSKLWQAQHSNIRYYSAFTGVSKRNPARGDLWVLDFSVSPDTFRFCMFFRQSNQWICERNAILVTALPSVLPTLHAEYQTQRSRLDIQKRPISPPPSLLTSHSPPPLQDQTTTVHISQPEDDFPWWLVIGGLVVAAGAVGVFLATSKPPSPSKPSELHGTISFPTPQNAP